MRRLPSPSWRFETVLLGAMIAGCASLPVLRQRGAERGQLRGDLASTRASLEDTRRELAEVRGDIGEIRRSSRGQGSIASRLDKLEQRMAALEKTGSQSKSVEPRAREAAQGASSTPAPLPAPAPNWPEIVVAELAREETREVPKEYRQALQLIREKAYEHAIQALYNFVRANPDSALAPDCHYWIGASYYLLGEHYRAIVSFNEVRERSAGSARAPAAALMIGFAFLQTGNKQEARLAFQKVVADYPSSREAAQARERLQDLGA
jgi:tol-pal system protein YbgF